MPILILFYENHKLIQIQMETRARQDIIDSQFCAQYLPAAVDRFVHFPKLFENPSDSAWFQLRSAYSLVLVLPLRSRYLGKYLYSTDPRAKGNKSLTRVVAERFVMAAPIWIKSITNIQPTKGDDMVWAETTLNLLVVLFLAFLKVDLDLIVPEATRKALEQVLLSFLHISGLLKGTFIPGTCRKLLVLFSKDDEHPPEMEALFKSFERDSRLLGVRRRDTCELPGCENKRNLKSCGRSVAYSTFPRL